MIRSLLIGRAPTRYREVNASLATVAGAIQGTVTGLGGRWMPVSVGPECLRLTRADVVGRLDLTGVVGKTPLGLQGCRITRGPSLAYATLRYVRLSGSLLGTVG